MLNKEGLIALIERLETQAVDLNELRRNGDLLREQLSNLRLDHQELEAHRKRIEDKEKVTASERDGLRIERDADRRLRAAAEAEVATLRNRPRPFPLLLDRKAYVYVAFENHNLSLTDVKDDAGDYQNAGDQPDFAALVAAPLNPRCYLTCNRLLLFRLPGPPVGKLLVEDDIPF